MILTREDVIKTAPPQDVIMKLRYFKEEYSIPHNRMKEAFIETIILSKFDKFDDYNTRCYATINEIEDELRSLSPMQLKDKYCYPLPIERELVLGYAIIEKQPNNGISSIDLKPITSGNKFVVDDLSSINNRKLSLFMPDIDVDYLDFVTANSITLEKDETFKGFVSAPFPTYIVDVVINGAWETLGCEHPTLTPPNWTAKIVSMIKKAIERSKDEQEKDRLWDIIKEKMIIEKNR